MFLEKKFDKIKRNIIKYKLPKKQLTRNSHHPMFFGEIKVFPVIVESQPKIDVGSYVYIDNPDDDMNLQTGIYQGNFEHVDGELRSLVVLDGNKNFYTLPHTVRIANN